jgi:hypothetical protein
MTDLPVCSMELFGNDVRQFWMEDLVELLVKYPNFEVPHRTSFFLLLLIDHAQGEISIDDQKIRLDESKAIIIKPYCINSIDINRAAKGKIICFIPYLLLWKIIGCTVINPRFNTILWFSFC